MAAIAGKSGLVTYATKVVAQVKSWSANIETDMLDVTSLTTTTGAQWRTFIPGLSGGNFTVDCLWDPSATASNAQKQMIVNLLAGTTAAVKLELDKSAGGSLNGSCFLNGGAFSVDIEGTADWSADGTFTGAVTYSSAT